MVFKRMQYGLLSALILILGLIPWQREVWADGRDVHIDARSYILMEMQSGLVLKEHRAEEPHPPASMTKIMTEYLVLEKVKEGKVHWDDEVRISPNAAALAGARVNLAAGEKRRVEELFTAMAVYSANDATVALAEHLAGSEKRFVEWMNQKAKEMGLKATHFRNSTGLPQKSYPNPPEVGGQHRMSARDVATLTRRLLQDYPDVKQTTSLPTYVFRQGEKRQKKLVNWNWMLPGLSHAYDGVDGVKTGYTREAGYCFAGSAKRNGMRLITVVMGTDTKTERFSETVKLMDYGFHHYQRKTVLSPKKPLPGYERVPVKRGVQTDVPLAVKDPVTLPVHKKQKSPVTYRVTFTRNLEAPLRAGTVVGKAEILYDGKEIPGMPPARLVIRQDVEEASWIRLLFRDVRDALRTWFG